MGYPMTYRRVLNRNRLNDGDYTTTPVDWHSPGGAVSWSTLDSIDKEGVIQLLRTLVENYQQAAERYNGKVRALMGDLRRLEQDTVDELAACNYIAGRTGLDPEVVAAVLKEFMAW